MKAIGRSKLIIKKLIEFSESAPSNLADIKIEQKMLF